MAITVIDYPFFVSAAKNKMAYVIDVDPAWGSYDDYYIKILVYKETAYRSGTAAALFECNAYPNAEDQVVFDLHRSLKGLLQPDTPIGYPASGYRICQKMNARYNVILEEWKNGAKINITTLTWQHILKAGFRSYLGQHLFDWTDNHKWLTHQPRSKKVSNIQPERLYYFLSENLFSTDLTVKVEVTYENGLTGNADPGWTITTAEAGDVIEITTGYQALNLAAAGQVASWKVWLEAPGGAGTQIVSEVQEYILDCYCSPLDRYFLFENTLGGYDVVKTTGEAKHQMQTESVTAERIAKINTYDEYRQSIQADTFYRNIVEQNVGFISPLTHEWLRSLHLSEDAYRLGLSGGLNTGGDLTPIPITINRGTVPLGEDLDFMLKQSFTYQDANPQLGL